jgi:invasion protein IalB
VISRISLALAAALVGGAALAQDAQDEGVTRREFSDWTMLCSADGAQCRMEQTGMTPEGESAMAMHVVKLPEPQSAEGRTMVAVGSFFVPLGVLLEPGLSLQIDAAEAQSAPYLLCQPNTCIVRVQMDENLVEAFKRGARARFGFVVLRNEQPVQVEASISLSGFTRAYDNLP